MVYIIHERLFSIKDDFIIRDEFGNGIFQVKSKLISIGNKLKLYDILGHELLQIEQRLFKFLPEYDIYRKDFLVAKIKKKLTFLKNKFEVDSVQGNYKIEGNIFDYDFSIKKDGLTVARVSKKIFAIADSYCVDVIDSEDQSFIIALVIVLDQVLHDKDSGNN